MAKINTKSTLATPHSPSPFCPLRWHKIRKVNIELEVTVVGRDCVKGIEYTN